ncbi:MAG: sialidase family protein [Fuerstiella sp.]
MKIRRRYLFVSILGALFVALACWYLSSDPDAPKRHWPELQAAEKSTPSVAVKVGPNVHVSVNAHGEDYWECVLACDPSDSRRLYGAAMLMRADPQRDIVAFYSHDGGMSWHEAVHRVCPAGHAFNDPAIAVGPDGAAYLAYMDVDRDASSSTGRVGSLVFLASSDGGGTWEERSLYSDYVDRPWLAVDTLSSRYRGRVYCLGQIEPRDASGEITHAEPILLVSEDGLDTLSEARSPHQGRQMLNCRPAGPVVFSDGTVMLAYMDQYLKRRIRGWPRPAIYVATTSDGGLSFEDQALVNTRWWHDHISSSPNSPSGVEFPQLAVDTESRFAERVYCVWSDGEKSQDASRVFFSFSEDRGRSWSQPVTLSEQALTENGDQSYSSWMPTVSVNKNGVVAVSWYDRRGLPGTRSEPLPGEKGIMRIVSEGWNVRLRLSVDGGATWQPSVVLNEQPGQGDIHVGHTAGLAASTDGRFHANWIDNRTGENEIWTASILVEEVP